MFLSRVTDPSYCYCVYCTFDWLVVCPLDPLPMTGTEKEPDTFRMNVMTLLSLYLGQCNFSSLTRFLVSFLASVHCVDYCMFMSLSPVFKSISLVLYNHFCIFDLSHSIHIKRSPLYVVSVNHKEISVELIGLVCFPLSSDWLAWSRFGKANCDIRLADDTQKVSPNSAFALAPNRRDSSQLCIQPRMDNTYPSYESVFI